MRKELTPLILAILLSVFTLGMVWQLGTGLTLMGETWVWGKFQTQGQHLDH